ncbi:MAG: ACT domain-containing protein [bacterium]
MDKLEIVAVIGENMRGTPGISGRLFSALGEEKVNVLAIAQGSSERNISFVIADKDKDRALNTLHRAFLGR